MSSGSQRNWRYGVDSDDWMRFMEKRMMHEERRPVIRTAAGLLGPGYAGGQYATQTYDWNNPDLLSNGWWFSEADLVINSPDDTTDWMGITEGTAEGDGIQTVWDYKNATPGDPIEQYSRRFWTVNGTTNYGPWMLVGGGGGGGGSPTGPAGGDLTGTYPNPQLGSGVVGSAEIADGSITTTDLAPATVSALLMDVQDENVTVVTDATLMDFQGAGVTVTTGVTGEAIVTIPGSGSTVAAPIGSMYMWPAAAAPSGYLLCNGQAVSRTTYATLFGICGTLYGAGDGSTTFNLPDLTGRFPRGPNPTASADAALGLTETGVSGGSSGSSTASRETRSDHVHEHGPGSYSVGNRNLGRVTNTAAGGSQPRLEGPDPHDHGFSGTSGASGLGPGTSNISKHGVLHLNFIIKAT